MQDSISNVTNLSDIPSKRKKSSNIEAFIFLGILLLDFCM